MGGKILMNSNSSARLYDYRVVSRGSLPHFPLEYSLITRNNFQCLYSNTLFGTMTMDSASHFEFFFLSHRCSFFFFVGELPYLLKGTAMERKWTSAVEIKGLSSGTIR